MKFEEYFQKNELNKICTTEQSEVFLTKEKKICKHYFNGKDKVNECFLYKFFEENDLIKIPKLFYIGDDFIETEFLEKDKKFDLSKTINEISNLYKKTKGIKLPLQSIDLSKKKLLYRISYLRDEVDKREVNPEILERAKSFVLKKYLYLNEKCIVHGDLKSPHIFNEGKEIKFLDFALSGIANPWYDLSFLCMEEQNDKESIFNQITEISFFNLKEDFDLTKEKAEHYLLSSMFYRTLYLFGFALRHRPQKSLDRIIKELNEIIK